MKNLKCRTKFIGINAACLFFLTIGANKILAQINTISKTQQHIYLSIDDRGSAANQYVTNKSNQIGIVTTILGNNIYPNDPLTLNEQTLTAAIQKAFPDPNASGICVMDWEGPAFTTLAYGDPSSAKYQSVLSQFQKALQIGKSARPNVKWGFYNFPFRRIVFKSDRDWRYANDKIAPLLQSVDVFFPALYDSYDIGDNQAQKGTLVNGQTIFDKDATEALRLADKYNKPVLPYIWHRYEIMNPAYRDKVIPPDEFANIAKTILNASYNGRKVNGIVWWSKDTEFYLHNNKQVRSEASDFNSFKSRYDSVVTNYSDVLLKQLPKKN